MTFLNGGNPRVNPALYRRSPRPIHIDPLDLHPRARSRTCDIVPVRVQITDIMIALPEET